MASITGIATVRATRLKVNRQGVDRPVTARLPKAECPQCGRRGEKHTRYCPHNLGPRDGR